MAEPESHDRLYAFMKFDRDQLIDWLNEYFGMDDTYHFVLTRCKSAYGVGTMTINDFEELSPDATAALADYLLMKLKSHD